MIRIEFWNGLISSKKKYEKYDSLVTTKHNPCLWSNVSIEENPWRNVYNKAIEYVSEWKLNKINDTQLLHYLRYVAYGYNNSGIDKRPYDNIDVIWPGNLTTKHKPKLVIQNGDVNYTLYFYFDSSETNNPTEHFWKINIVEKTDFYWDLSII